MPDLLGEYEPDMEYIVRASGLRISADNFDLSSSDKRKVSVDADVAVIKVSTHHKSGRGGIFNGCQVEDSDEEEHANRIVNVLADYPFATSHTVTYGISRSDSSSSSSVSISSPRKSPRKNPGHYTKDGRYLGAKIGLEDARF